MSDLDDLAAGVDLYMDLYLRAYTAWMRMCENVVDPRVWTHCKILKYPDGHEEMMCDGVLVGHFAVTREHLNTKFVGHVIRKEDSPWRDPAVADT